MSASWRGLNSSPWRRSGACGPASWALAGWGEEAAWIERHRKLWAARFDALDQVIEELKRKEKADGRKRIE
jgi:hypothetical protein